MTRCPVCGMEIEESAAKRVDVNGHTYVVASEDCKKRFLANPAKHAGMSEHSAHQQGHKHACC